MGAATDTERLEDAVEVARAVGDGRLPDPAFYTADARTLGSFFGAHNETLGEPVNARLAALYELGPAMRIVPRSIHPVSGEGVIIVVVAVPAPGIGSV